MSAKYNSEEFSCIGFEPRGIVKALAEEMDFVKRNDRPQSQDKFHIVNSHWLQKWTKYVRGAGPHPGLNLRRMV